MSEERVNGPNPTGDDHGFTLVEVLVALALMAIMLATITATYRFGRQAWDRVDEMDKTASVAAVQSYLSDLFSGVRPAIERTPQGAERLIFEGEPHRVRFIANSQGRTVVGGLYVFELGQAGALDGAELPDRALLVRLVIYRPGAPVRWGEGSGAHRRAILDETAEVSFRYFGVASGGSEAGWHDSWRSQRALPALIEVRVRFKPADSRSWAPLVVELKLR